MVNVMVTDVVFSGDVCIAIFFCHLWCRGGETWRGDGRCSGVVTVAESRGGQRDGYSCCFLGCGYRFCLSVSWCPSSQMLGTKHPRRGEMQERGRVEAGEVVVCDVGVVGGCY